MKIFALLLTMFCHCFCQASSLSPSTTQEIAQLFSYLENSACQLQRNGTWYDAKAASAHLQKKYQYLLDKNLIVSSESFIQQAATASSMSGNAYQVKCPNAAIVDSASWFRNELIRYRLSAHK
ncbi:DUF5329 domain-containing protein [Undibacterium sp. Ren11W]|uniref:DUF5329 domain-containing protein n=1 Tax=Undibacterium sp. Ren11W TaxID=3413045 RepID=UPI003BF0C42C